MEMGHKKWCIPDLYMKEPGDKPTPSHESITLLNVGGETAFVNIDLLFDNGDEVITVKDIQVDGKRAVHLRMDQLEQWNVRIPVSECYSAILISSQKIVVEYARLNWIDGAVQSFAVIPYYED